MTTKYQFLRLCILASILNHSALSQSSEYSSLVFEGTLTPGDNPSGQYVINIENYGSTNGSQDREEPCYQNTGFSQQNCFIKGLRSAGYYLIVGTSLLGINFGLYYGFGYLSHWITDHLHGLTSTSLISLISAIEISFTMNTLTPIQEPLGSFIQNLTFKLTDGIKGLKHKAPINDAMSVIWAATYRMYPMIAQMSMDKYQQLESAVMAIMNGYDLSHQNLDSVEKLIARILLHNYLFNEDLLNLQNGVSAPLHIIHERLEYWASFQVDLVLNEELKERVLKRALKLKDQYKIESFSEANIEELKRILAVMILGS